MFPLQSIDVLFLVACFPTTLCGHGVSERLGNLLLACQLGQSKIHSNHSQMHLIAKSNTIDRLVTQEDHTVPVLVDHP